MELSFTLSFTIVLALKKARESCLEMNNAFIGIQFQYGAVRMTINTF